METLRDRILKKRDLRRERLHIPEWEVDVFVSTMTGAERDEFENECQQRSVPGGKFDIRGIKALLVVLTAKDENGNLIFTRDDIPELLKKNAKPLDDIATLSQKVNGIGKAELEAIKGNSQSAPSGGTGTV